MKITLLNGTTNNPLEKIGYNAGICWNSPTDDKDKNIARAIDCIKSGHGRVMEFVDIEFVLEGASARMIRELYTHIGGSPTRLQSSTRYVDASNFTYFTPPKIEENNEARKTYDFAMRTVAGAYDTLCKLGIPKEDAANLLPLGMNSKVVMKCNSRMLANLMNQRLCTRAYHEFRKFAKMLKDTLANKNDEWKYIAEELFVPKCIALGYCTEKKSCGKTKSRIE